MILLIENIRIFGVIWRGGKENGISNLKEYLIEYARIYFIEINKFFFTKVKLYYVK